MHAARFVREANRSSRGHNPPDEARLLRFPKFRLTETREPTLIQEMLKDYKGILISDFYGGYDACVCRQQKCLVHLIRDLNDDLWKNPFNSELEGFVSAVKDLLVPIMVDVDKYGLKRRHFHKHQQT